MEHQKSLSGVGVVNSFDSATGKGEFFVQGEPMILRFSAGLQCVLISGEEPKFNMNAFQESATPRVMDDVWVQYVAGYVLRGGGDCAYRSLVRVVKVVAWTFLSEYQIAKDVQGAHSPEDSERPTLQVGSPQIVDLGKERTVRVNVEALPQPSEDLSPEVWACLAGGRNGGKKIHHFLRHQNRPRFPYR